MAKKNKNIYIKNKKTRDQNSLRKIRSIIYNIKFIYKILSSIFIIVNILLLNYSKSFNKKINDYFQEKISDEKFLGLKLKNVYLEGQNYTNNKDIVKALSVNIDSPILPISLNKIKDKLEKLSWVKEATIERRLPSSLYVKITEREPIALWQNKGKLFLIDIEGKVIITDKISQFVDLILLIGNNAPFHYPNLLPLISKNKNLFTQIFSVTRISERRWNIKMKTGTEIKLPENNESKAWNIVNDLFEEGKLNNDLKTIDLRIDNKIYINGEVENF